MDTKRSLLISLLWIMQRRVIDGPMIMKRVFRISCNKNKKCYSPPNVCSSRGWRDISTARTQVIQMRLLTWVSRGDEPGDAHLLALSHCWPCPWRHCLATDALASDMNMNGCAMLGTGAANIFSVMNRPLQTKPFNLMHSCRLKAYREPREPRVGDDECVDKEAFAGLTWVMCLKPSECGDRGLKCKRLMCLVREGGMQP